MHSVGLKSSWTSLRTSSSVLLVSIWSSDEMDNVIARFCFDRDFAASEDSGTSFASKCDGAVFANQPGPFANSDHRCFVLLEKLKNPFLLCLAHMPGIGIWVSKVWTDLKRHESKRIERAWLNDRHVFGGFDRRPSNVGAGATPDVRRAAFHFAANRVQQVEILQSLQQTKRIAATNENRIRLLNRFVWIGCCMDCLERVAHCLNARPRFGRVIVAFKKCERKEKNSCSAPEKAFDLLLDVIEVTTPIDRGIAHQQDSRCGFHLLH